jgi:hypothetical protein
MKTTSKVGRPKFEVTEKDRTIVRMLVGFGIPQDKIVLALGISLGTLHRYFKPEMKAGSAQVEAQLIGNLLRLSDGNDGTSLKATMFALQARFGWSIYAPPAAPKEPARGKKEILSEEAQTGHVKTGWGDLLQ